MHQCLKPVIFGLFSRLKISNFYIFYLFVSFSLFTFKVIIMFTLNISKKIGLKE